MRTLTLIVVTSLAACGPEPTPSVEVGPVAFQEEQLLGLTPARRLALARLAAFGLAVADSSTAELGAPLLRRWEGDRLLDILAAELTLEEHEVGDDVLEARYLTDPDYELTVRHVLFFSERWRTADERQAASAKAERALEAIRSGADFAETAATLSEEPGAAGRQGLLTPGREGAWVDEFWAAASALQPGEISPVTETQYGFHILRLEDRNVVPFAEARSEIAREVANRIEDPRAVLDRWLEGVRGSISPDAEAITRLAEGSAMPEEVLAVGPDEATLTVSDWAAWAATVTSPRGGEAGTTSVAELMGEIEELALRNAALAEAEARNLSVPEAERARIARRWEDLVYRWSTSLRFNQGMSPSEVAEASLRALGDPGQGAVIVRDEIDAHGPLIEHRYEISVRPHGG